jgi:hypothetical protein
MEAAVSIRSYRDLEVWQEAVALAEECYRITRSFPRDEIFRPDQSGPKGRGVGSIKRRWRT